MDTKQLHENFKKQRKREGKKIKTYQLLLLVFLFISWEITTHFRILDPLIFSSPLSVAKLKIKKIIEIIKSMV